MMSGDSFNRADSNSVGTPWVELETDVTQFQIVSNQLKLNHTGLGSNLVLAYGAKWRKDQSSKATLITNGATADVPGTLAVRISSCGAASNDRNYYCLRISNTGRTQLVKLVNGVQTILDDQLANPVQAGDVLEIKAVGTTITATRNGVNIHSVTDASITEGKPGFALSVGSGSHTFDEWTGTSISGTFSATCPGEVFVCATDSATDSDKFNRGVLIASPAFPWIEKFDPQYTSPFRLVPNTGLGNHIFAEGTHLLNVASSRVSPDELPRGFIIFDSTYGTDQFSGARFIQGGGPNFSNTLPTAFAVRMNTSAAWNTQTGYVLLVDSTSQGNAFRIYKLANLVLTLLAESTASVAPNDTVELHVVGSTINAFKNAISIVQATDSTYSSGKAGFCQLTNISWAGLGTTPTLVFQEFDFWVGGECGKQLSSKNWCKS